MWYDWQKKILDIVESEPDDRTINWVYDKKGGIGKSFLCKYLCLKYDYLIADGKKDNVFNQLKTMIDENKDIKCILLDIPRHCNEYINYGMLEQLKNGFCYSGKYEGDQLFFEDCHVIVFSNCYPDKEKFTNDRWNIISM